MEGYIIDEKLKKRYLEWWNRENEYPMLAVYSRKTIPRIPSLPLPTKNPERRWTDAKYMSKVIRLVYSNMYCGGDAVPIYFPDLGPDILGAMSGLCDIKYSWRTTWAEPRVKDWDDIGEIKFDENNPFWNKLLEVIKMATGIRKNLIVGITDLHSGTDGLVSLRGPENLCYDLVDCPELVEKKLDEMTNMYKEVYTRLDNLIEGEKYGRSTWNMVWSDTPYNVVSSDFSGMIGPKDYERFVAPHIQAEIDFLDHSIYHVDGVDALKHLDRILAFKGLTGVEWVPGAGKPPMREWIHILKRIQDAGKVIEVSVEEADIKPLCDNLDPRGLLMSLFVMTKTKADRLARFVQGYKVPKRMF
jgi:hypothetical protein